MFSRTGRYSVEFRYRNPGTWERHQMLNSDDKALAHRGFDESVKACKPHVANDIVGIRIMDNVTGATLKQWHRGMWG